ncbi:MAG: PBP1A family penicillin-binding protein [Nitrospinae bacterium]|nr:PBP1A family penicillin-binding protein [Nitrospinota bacterium]
MLFRKKTVAAALLAGALAGALVGSLFARFTDMPSVRALEDYTPPVSTRIYSDDGRIIGEFFQEKRELLAFSQIPQDAVNAVLAAEDAHFYEHRGFRVYSLLRALAADIRARRLVQGGSTITQQLAKTLFLSSEKTFSRKLKELMIALQLEINYTKSELLTFYFNQIYFGSGAYGLEAAAQVYFGKHAGELTLAESAVIGALPRGPSIYSPYNDMAKARARREWVLGRMAEEGFITEAQRAAAAVEPITLATRKKPEVAPYFVETIRLALEEKYGGETIYRQGLAVHTTLNIEMQLAATQALAEGLKEAEERINRRGGNPEGLPLQGALIAIDPATGAVKAMVGGRDFAESQFNRALHAQRQPGSAFKPVVYAAAIRDGLTPATFLIESPVEMDDPAFGGNWKPKNYENRFYGKVTMRRALTHSMNVASVKLFMQIGPEKVIRFARDAGIRSEVKPYPSSALGGSEVTLAELTSAYALFANKGQRAELEMIRNVDKKGGGGDSYFPILTEVMGAPQAFLMTSMLKSVVDEGTGRAAQLAGRPAAGKTGTTDDFTDAWFVGYTPHLAAGVWVGYDIKKSLGEGESGGRVAAPIWNRFMKSALTGKESREFKVPDGIEEVVVDDATGLLANPRCGKSHAEYFEVGTAPDQSCLDAR